MYSNTDDGEETKNPEIQKKEKKKKRNLCCLNFFYTRGLVYM